MPPIRSTAFEYHMLLTILIFLNSDCYGPRGTSGISNKTAITRP